MFFFVFKVVNIAKFVASNNRPTVTDKFIKLDNYI